MKLKRVSSKSTNGTSDQVPCTLPELPVPFNPIMSKTFAIVLAATVIACSQPVPVAETPAPAISVSATPTTDSGGFLTRLGVDTIALESFVRTTRGIDALVVLRVPTTTYTRYSLTLRPNGEMDRLESIELSPADGTPVRREVITRAGDSLQIVATDTGAPRTRTVAAPSATLPFIDMAHWPYEIVTRRSTGSGSSSLVQPLLTGRSTSDFRIERIGNDSITITHPNRGTMRARVDENGRLLGLDAGATTRKLTVERVRWMPLAAVAARFAVSDRAGKNVGALSGRGSALTTVGNATVNVDFGMPAKRGRNIWGALVPYGQVWRTGANLATHLETDRPLVLGSGSDTLTVPAGKYTLFTIPERDGGLLIVNQQTGQGGTTYDAKRDLGRVRMTARSLTEPAELFTIRVSPIGARGELRLQWDRTEMVVPVRTQ